jgi:hypothetical protein
MCGFDGVVNDILIFSIIVVIASSPPGTCVVPLTGNREVEELSIAEEGMAASDVLHCNSVLLSCCCLWKKDMWIINWSMDK